MGEVIKVVLKGTLMGSVATRGIFYHECGTGLSKEELAVDWNTWFYSGWTHVKSHYASLWTSESTEYFLKSAEDWQSYSVKTSTFAGDDSTHDIAGYQPAVLLTLTTAAFKVVGRKFLPGISEYATTAGALAGGVVTDHITALADWLTPGTDGMGHYFTWGTVDKTGTYRAFNGGVVGEILSSMRRRKPGYGI